MSDLKHGDIVEQRGIYSIVRDYIFKGERHGHREFGPAVTEIPLEEITLSEQKEFEVKNQVYLTDPCYSLGTWCQEPLLNKCLPGKWTGLVFGERDYLVAHHVEHPVGSMEKFSHGRKPKCDLGVDSGMIAILNRTLTSNEYEVLIDHFCTDKTPLILDVGVISSTKFGDGSYGYQYITNQDGYIVAIAIDMT